tara:strand:- start:218 stop:403 length:186 start_codon:yes stop_codon:yes gene_type:complete
MSEWKKLKKDIEKALKEEKVNLESYDPLNGDPGMDNCRGWIEALKYVLGRMNSYENKNEDE